MQPSLNNFFSTWIEFASVFIFGFTRACGLLLFIVHIFFVFIWYSFPFQLLVCILFFNLFLSSARLSVGHNVSVRRSPDLIYKRFVCVHCVAIFIATNRLLRYLMWQMLALFVLDRFHCLLWSVTCFAVFYLAQQYPCTYAHGLVSHTPHKALVHTRCVLIAGDERYQLCASMVGIGLAKSQ